MVMSYTLRLIGILNDLEKPTIATGYPSDNQYKLNNDFCENYYPLQKTNILNPAKLPSFYDNPISSTSEVYDNSAFFATASDKYTGLASVLGKNDSYLIKNNGADIKDYFNECINAYNLCGRYRDEGNRKFKITYDYSHHYTRYNSDGVIIIDYTSVISGVELSSTLSNVISDHQVYTNLIYSGSGNDIWKYERNEYYISFVLEEVDIVGLEQAGRDFLDELKIISNHFELNSPDTGSVFENYTFNHIESTNDYSLSITDPILLSREDPTNIPSDGNLRFSNRLYISELLMRYKQITFQDLIVYDPAPSTWL